MPRTVGGRSSRSSSRGSVRGDRHDEPDGPTACGRRASVSRAQELTAEELVRYQRHLTLAGVGIDGQRRLANGSALVVGVGGLGSPIALYLAAAGVGRIGLVDDDTVDLANLQRQVL
ncbi:MAG: ThiF family adenylyltransferase, partial [Candidatus Bipolaricaulota bacterium]